MLLLTPAVEIPGVAVRRSSSRRTKSRAFSSVYRSLWSPRTTTAAGSLPKPGSTVSRSRKLRRKRLVVTSSTNATATWATTSAPRGLILPRFGGAAPTVSVLRLSITSHRVDSSAGTRPKDTPATSDAVRANPSTTGSRLRSRVTGMGSGRSAWASRWRSSHARRTPAAPPSSASTMLSVRSCRTSARRRAPRASRTATSRRRPRACARRKLARLAHAMRRTSPTTASRSAAAETTTPSTSGLT